MTASLPLTLQEFEQVQRLLSTHRGTSTELASVLDKLEKLAPAKHAYLVLITWPNGTEGLLFPRPGNVPVADSEVQGRSDFRIARKHLLEHAAQQSAIQNGLPLDGAVIRLIQFERGAVLDEFTL